MTTHHAHGHGPVPLSLSAPARMARIRYYNAPSPKGTNHAQIYVRSDGALIDRTGALWGRASMGLDGQLAYDELPAPAAAGERKSDEERRVQEFRNEIEALIGESGLDLHDDAIGPIIECLNKHFPIQSKRQLGPNARVAKDKARGCDEVLHEGPADLGGFKAFLKAKGIRAEDVAEALRIVDRENEESAEDVLPANALGGKLDGHVRDDEERERPWDRIVPEVHHPERDRLMPQVRDRAVSVKDKRQQAADAAERMVAGEASAARRYGEDFVSSKRRWG